MSYPYCGYLGPSIYLVAFFDDLTMKYTTKIGGRHVKLILAERVLARWQHLVTFMKVMNLIHWVMRVVSPAHRHGHRNGQKSGYILHCWFVCCCPGGRRGNTERVVTWWLRPVVSGVTLVMLHWVMRSVSLQCVCVAIHVVREGGTFALRHCLFCLA
jgi:hypothetical protein